jgi:epoxyqueuosine reductase QueG
VVLEFVATEGACAAGISTAETLAGGPPTCDLSYVLPGAAAAVTFAVAIDPGAVPAYLGKQDRLGFERDYLRANTLASGIAFQLANHLDQSGHPSVPVAANLVYRPEAPGGPAEYLPQASHRYLAARSGVGHLGLSGNLITRDHGAAVILATTVTAAPLVATAPLPPEDNYCDACSLCAAACPSGYLRPGADRAVSLGGVEFRFWKQRATSRCDCVCSGYTGLHPSGKWSTWSPGRLPLPADDAEIPPALERMARAHGRWPPAPGGRHLFYTPDKLRVACAHCQLVCCPDPAERRARFRTLAESGVVVQNPDGALEAVPPGEAATRLAGMPPERRALYQDP